MNDKYTQPYRLIMPQQKRLRDAFAAVMDASGLVFEHQIKRRDDGVLYDRLGRLPRIEARIRRPEDALNFLRMAQADVAVLGFDAVNEFNLASSEETAFRMTRLPGVAECRLSISAKPSMWFRAPSDLSETRIVTKYPATLRSWLKQNEVEGVRIVPCAGGAEDSVDMDLADAAFEIVETGTTLRAYGLEEKIPVIHSSAILVARDSGNPLRASLTRALIECLIAPPSEKPAPVRIPELEPACR